jgi:hypothetical protein
VGKSIRHPFRPWMVAWMAVKPAYILSSIHPIYPSIPPHSKSTRKYKIRNI